MKRLWFLLLLFAFGCASFGNGHQASRIDALEQEVTKLRIMVQTGQSAAVDRIWPFYGLSAGNNGLNAILYANIGANDMAKGRDSNGFGYEYYWDATWPHASACTSPSCIKPSDIPGATNGAWMSIDQFYMSSFVSTAPDGDHFIDPSNSSAFPTGIAEGSITCRDDRDACFEYDGTEWIPMYAGKYVEYTVTTNPMPSDDCWGAVITNDGAAGAITLTLPSAEKYMMCTFIRVDASGNMTIEELGGDNILDLDNIILGAGDSVTLFAISTSTWVVVSDSRWNDGPTYTP